MERIAPIFAVHDLDVAMEHYQRLGFTVRAYPGGGYGFASRGRVEIHLGVVPGDDRRASSAYLFVNDADGLDAAIGLLRDTSLPVTVIATKVGYTSEAAFSRAFKNRYGTPPARWRRGFSSLGCRPSATFLRRADETGALFAGTYLSAT